MRRALVIGSQVGGLSGVHHDVAAMAALLERHDFETDRRIESDATRAGILDGYARLISSTGPLDAAVVYYSGHGAYACWPSGTGGARYLQCIVPTDWGADGEFRGVLDVELSARLAALTARTDNVSVLLDCCHAAHMSRGTVDTRFVRRSLGSAWLAGVEEFARRNAIDLAGPCIESNPKAVRLVATEVERAAYEVVEQVDRRPMSMGLMTRGFQVAMQEADGVPITWHAIGLRVRELVMERQPRQRPEIEGPAERLVFQTAIAARSDAVVFFYDAGRPALRAGPLQGARTGAVYEILQAGRTLRAANAAVAEATVTGTSGPCAYVALRRLQGSDDPRAGALAFPRELPFDRLPVAIGGDAAATSAIAAAILGSRFLEVAPPGCAALFEVVAGATFDLLDSEGEIILRAQPVERIIAALERQAKAEALRNLPAGGLPVAAASVRIERVSDGRAFPLDPGETLHVGDSICVTVDNRTRGEDLHVAVFDLDIDGTVRLLSALSPTGRRLSPGCSLTLPELRGGLRGFEPLAWPAEVPPTGTRGRSLVVVVADGWHEFRLLETPRATADRAGSHLEALLDAVRRGATRSFAPSGAAPRRGGRYLMTRRDFRLSPTPRANAGARDGPSNPMDHAPRSTNDQGESDANRTKSRNDHPLYAQVPSAGSVARGGQDREGHQPEQCPRGPRP